MGFAQWASSIVANVRRYLPSARAARRGRSLVIIRYDGREAHLHDKGSVCTVTFVASSPGATMASRSDQRRDSFTTRNLAKSILMRARDSMSFSHRNALSYKRSTFQLEQRKCAVSPRQLSQTQNQKRSGFYSNSTKCIAGRPEASGARRFFRREIFGRRVASQSARV